MVEKLTLLDVLAPLWRVVSYLLKAHRPKDEKWSAEPLSHPRLLTWLKAKFADLFIHECRFPLITGHYSARTLFLPRHLIFHGKIDTLEWVEWVGTPSRTVVNNQQKATNVCISPYHQARCVQCFGSLLGTILTRAYP
jgi:hypothetical protein